MVQAGYPVWHRRWSPSAAVPASGPGFAPRTRRRVRLASCRAASNVKAKREFGWTLRYPSWRQGFLAACTTPEPGESHAAQPVSRPSGSPA